LKTISFFIGSAMTRFIARNLALSFLCFAIILPVFIYGQQAPTHPGIASQLSPDSSKRIDELIRQMTLEEKAGQLSLLSPFSPVSNIQLLLEKGLVGAMSPSFRGVEETDSWQLIAVEKSRLHIPLLIGLDVIHGHRTIFPVPVALAGSFDPALIEKTVRVAASEAKAEGVSQVFAPMVDVARDARWGRIVESPGEDPFLASAMARAYVAGFQGKALSDPNSVATSVKHFATYGAAESGRDYNAVDISERTLWSVYLPPFHAAVEAGSAGVLAAFNSINGVPITADRRMLTDILRTRWGFSGFVLSDAGAIAELTKHGVALDEEQACLKAISAGLDMDLGGESYSRYLPGLVRSGQLPEPVLDEAVRRVLRVKFALGLFDHPFVSQIAVPFPKEEKRNLARQSVYESVVLLKNADSSGKPVLPLRGKPAIALIGPLADAAAQMMGPWAVVGESKDVITLKTSLAERAARSGTKLIYAKGCEILKDSEQMSRAPSIGEFIGKPEPETPPRERLKGQEGFAQAVQAAKESDVVIMALGEDRTMSGEAGSRANLGIPGEQEALLEAIADTGKPIVLVLFSGRPLAIPWAASHVPAILQAWYPGDEAGPGLVDILFGDANPSGHLSVSIPRSVGQEPLYYSRLTTGRPPEGLDLSHPPRQMSERFFSRYIDEQNSALFPFGWGLSYTTFSFSTPTVSRTAVEANSIREDFDAPLAVSVKVTNSGAVAGDAVVQLYLGITGASVALPSRELKGFRRVSLKPGQSEDVTFPLGYNELSFLDASAQRVIQPVHYRAWAGDSSLAEKFVDFETK
jgi:beta-glucosidase